MRTYDWPLSRRDKRDRLIHLYKLDLQVCDAELRRKDAMLAMAQRQIQVDRLARRVPRNDLFELHQQVQESEAKNQQAEAALEELTFEREHLLEELSLYKSTLLEKEERCLEQEDEINRLERELWISQPTGVLDAPAVKGHGSEEHAMHVEDLQTGSSELVERETVLDLVSHMEQLHHEMMQAMEGRLRRAMARNRELEARIQCQAAPICSPNGLEYADGKRAASADKFKRRKGKRLAIRRRDGAEAVGRRTRCRCRKLARRALRAAMKEDEAAPAHCVGTAVEGPCAELRAVCRQVQEEQSHVAAGDRKSVV